MSDETTGVLVVPALVTDGLKALPERVRKRLSLSDADRLTRPCRDEIDRLRAENERLRAAIEHAPCPNDDIERCGCYEERENGRLFPDWMQCWKRAALGEG